MDVPTQWYEEDGDSSHTYFEPSAELSPPPLRNGNNWDPCLDSTSSQFGSAECGEPMVPQRIMLHFTPSEGPAGEEEQRKVFAFWEFLDKHPELDTMACEEEKQEPTLETISSASPELTFAEDDTLDRQTTALSTLCLYDTTGAIDRAFQTKMKNTACDLEQPSYFDRTTAPLKNICLPDASSHSSGDLRVEPSREELGRLNRALCTWDERHPKSMEPPRHPAPLSRAELSRRVDHQCADYDETLRRNDPYNY